MTSLFCSSETEGKYLAALNTNCSDNQSSLDEFYHSCGGISGSDRRQIPHLFNKILTPVLENMENTDSPSLKGNSGIFKPRPYFWH